MKIIGVASSKDAFNKWVEELREKHLPFTVLEGVDGIIFDVSISTRKDLLAFAAWAVRKQGSFALYVRHRQGTGFRLRRYMVADLLRPSGPQEHPMMEALWIIAEQNEVIEGQRERIEELICECPPLQCHG